jgi:hypothetical protein
MGGVVAQAAISEALASRMGRRRDERMGDISEKVSAWRAP